MKKFIIAVLFALLPMVGNAQLHVTGNVEKAETIASVRTGQVKFCCSSEGLYYITMPTTNKFDKLFLLYLGNTKESARLTLLDLIKLSKSIKKGEEVTIDNAGKPCQIHKGAMGGLTFFNDECAGFASLTNNEMGTFYNRVNKAE